MARILLSVFTSLFLVISSAQALTLEIDLLNRTFNWVDETEIHFNNDEHPSTIFGSFAETVTIAAPFPLSSGTLSDITSFDIGINEAGTEIALVWFQGMTTAGPATLSGTSDAPANPVFLFEEQDFSFFDKLLPGSYKLAGSPVTWSNSLTVNVIPEPTTTTLIAGAGILLLALLRRFRTTS